MKPVDELRHVLNGSNPDERLQGFDLLSYNVYCEDNAEEVLRNCREILKIMLRQCEKETWLSETEWYQILPSWFIFNCAPERTLEEEEEDNARWQALSVEEQIIEQQNETWSVMDFTSWFEPGENGLNERYWSWWNAFVPSPELLVVVVEIMDFPFPSGCLIWLFKACGAIKIEREF